MTFKPQHFPEHLYFITGSLLGWHRRQKRVQLYSYVVMPTHFHVIIKPVGNHTLSTNLQSLGSFTAYSILHQLRVDSLTSELDFFAANREPDRTEQHQIWQPMQAKNIYTLASLYENRIHFIRPAMKSPGYKTAPDQSGLKSSRIYSASFRR